jgi:hypothetical protein
MTPHPFFLNKGRGGGWMGAKKEIIWDIEKERKGVRNRQPDAFFIAKKYENEHCLFGSYAYCGLIFPVVY